MRYSKKNILIQRAVKGRGFHAPAYSPAAHRLVRALGGLYLKYAEDVGRIGIENLETFIEAFSSFQRGDSRLIVAFRHPSRKDPPVLSWAFNQIIPKMAQKAGTPLKEVPHCRFLYGVDVLNWAGLPAVITFPRLGFIPVENLGTNRQGMDILKKELVEGRFPIALAPEGQVTYHTRHCAKIASGTANLAQWALESGKDVQILPVGLDYEFADPLSDVFKILERISRIGSFDIPDFENTVKTIQGETGPHHKASSMRSLLFTVTARVFSVIEDFYKAYTAAGPVSVPDEESLADSRDRLCHIALAAAESLAGIPASGSILERVYRIRYEGMRRLFPDEIDPQTRNDLQRRIADFRAVEAKIFLRHSQIVDILEYIDPDYIGEKSCGATESEIRENYFRFTEYTLNLLDLFNRMEGGNIESRYHLHRQNITIKAGPIIHAGTYLQNGTGRKASRANLSLKIHEELQNVSTGLQKKRLSESSL